jgi:hypothetical protein
MEIEAEYETWKLLLEQMKEPRRIAMEMCVIQSQRIDDALRAFQNDRFGRFLWARQNRHRLEPITKEEADRLSSTSFVQ